MPDQLAIRRALRDLRVNLCDYSWLPAATCAHCLDHHLDPAVAAAWDY